MIKGTLSKAKNDTRKQLNPGKLTISDKRIDSIIIITGFVLGPNLFLLLKMTGLSESYFELHGLNYPFPLRFLGPSLSGLLIGLTLLYFENRLFRRYEQNYPNYIMLPIRLCIATVVIVVEAFAIQMALAMVISGATFQQALAIAYSFIYSGLFLSIYLFMIVLGFTLNFLRQLGNWLGYSVLFNYFLGRYRQPQEEERIFMFLDLNQSTTLAEQLGHIKYSRFLNRCFNDMTPWIERYGAEVYQYVGDEVVLSWPLYNSQKDLDCLRLFFDFDEAISSESEHYHNKFGVIPSFKATVHVGKVAIADVGGKRKSTAYHGDVLNTCARMLELCKRFNKKILISEAIAKWDFIGNEYDVNLIKEFVLRGKSVHLSIYALHAKEKIKTLR